MANFWITDITHLLKADGSGVDGLARPIARHFAQIVRAGSVLPAGLPLDSDIPCRRRPKSRRCSGCIRIRRLDKLSRIEWRCPLCGDQGMIYNWEGSLWDIGAQEGTPSEEITA